MQVCSVCKRCYDDKAHSCDQNCAAALSRSHDGGPEMVPGYRLDAWLRSGPNFTLYRAHEEASGGTCLVRIASVADEDRDEFLEEARVAAALFHPNLVDVYHAGTLESGDVFVVTEDADGRTLRNALDEIGVPKLLTSVEIIRQAAEALHAIHLAGLTHRAVNPDNILLSAGLEGQMVVRIQGIDLGGVGQRSIVSNKLAIDGALGSLRYFAPEQCSGEETGPRTDVYSLGIVYFELLAGVPPFDATTATALIHQHRNQHPPEVRIENFELRMLVTHSLTESLQKPVRLRQSSANVLARQLRHIEQLATHSSTPPPAGKVNIPAPGRIFTPPFKSAQSSVDAGSLPRAEAGKRFAGVAEPAPVMSVSEHVDDAVPVVDAVPPTDPVTSSAPPATPRRSRLKPSKRKLHAIVAQLTDEGEVIHTEPAAENEARPATVREAKTAAETEAQVEAEKQAKAAAEREARIVAEQQAVARLNAETKAKLAAEREAARLTAEREAARKLAVEREAELTAQTEAARKLAAEREAELTAEREAARKLAAEREAELTAQREAARKLAAEREAELAAEQEAARRLAAEADAVRRLVTEREAQLAIERETAARLAAEREAELAAEREAARLAREREAQLAAETAAARKLADEREAELVAERMAIARLAAEKDAAAKLVAEREAQLAVEREANARLAAERETDIATKREAVEAKEQTHVDSPAPAITDTTIVHPRIEEEPVDISTQIEPVEAPVTESARPARVPSPVEKEKAVAARRSQDMGLTDEVPERLRRPVQNIKVWRLQDEEITLVRPPRSRFRIDLEKTSARPRTTRAANSPIPDTLAFYPTLLSRTDDPPSREAEVRDGMFSSVYVRTGWRIPTGRRSVLLGCGFAAILALVLFGNDSISRYFQGWSSADSVSSRPRTAAVADGPSTRTTLTVAPAAAKNPQKPKRETKNVAEEVSTKVSTRTKTDEQRNSKAPVPVQRARTTAATRDPKPGSRPAGESKRPVAKPASKPEKTGPLTRPRIVQNAN